MAVDTERRAKKTASRLDHALLSQPITDAMSFTSPNNGSEVSALAIDRLHQSPVTLLPLNPASPGKEYIAQSPQQSGKKRRPSKSKVPSELRRSSSTPHMRNIALANSGELSPTSNKPRNKLGYHRTSVACGHCRRRKIRCLLASDDPQGRCANCIRLKKECNFYPVEHNPDGEHTQSVSTKDSTPAQPLTPATSSPRHLPPAVGEKGGEFRAPFHGASTMPQNPTYSFQAEPELEPHQAPGPGESKRRLGLREFARADKLVPVQQQQQQPYPYPHPIETQWPPTSSFLPSSTVAESPQSSTSYWRQSPSTATSVYGSESNVSGGHTPAAMSTSSTMSYGHPEGHPWAGQPPFQPPTRSMSYGNIEGLPQQYAGQGLALQQHDYIRRTPTYPYPTSLDTNAATMHATTMGHASAAPLSAPIIPNHQFYPPTWNSYEGAQNHGPPIQQMSGRSMSAQWYPEPGHLDRVQEEGAPPIGYSHHGVQQFYSGA